MTLSMQPYKGARDFYPEDMKIQSWMFEKMHHVISSFGYEQYNAPMLEPVDLYAAKTGQEIVEKQLYAFTDRGGRNVALRPEMTPSLARMVAARFQQLPKPIRWYSIPNLWRYEKPQRGRLREHWQLNCDLLGGERVLADTEILMLACAIVDAYGGSEFVKIRINHRGLMDHVFAHHGLLGENALAMTKLLDARSKIGEEVFVREATLIADKKLLAFFDLPFERIAIEYPCLGTQELTHVMQVLGDRVQFDSSIMRGMDYYTGLVFEMYDQSPENPRAMFGGGRFDNLIGLFGKNDLSGVGFGFGDVTLRHFLETHNLLPQFGPKLDVFISLPDAGLFAQIAAIAAQLRPELRVVTALESGGFREQLKMADKLEARFVVLFGAEEESRGAVLVKDLIQGVQHEVQVSALQSFILERKGTV